MIAAAWLFTLQLVALRVFSMPYQVPLQGKVGGKRTLVVVENEVTRRSFLDGSNIILAEQGI